MSEFHNGCGRISRVDTVVCIKLYCFFLGQLLNLIIFIKAPEFDDNACIDYLMILQPYRVTKRAKK